MKKALLVIDLQEEYFENRDSFKNQFKLDMSNFHQRTFNSVDEYMNSVNKIIEKEQSLGTEIIYHEVYPSQYSTNMSERFSKHLVFNMPMYVIRNKRSDIFGTIKELFCFFPVYMGKKTKKPERT